MFVRATFGAAVACFLLANSPPSLSENKSHVSVYTHHVRRGVWVSPPMNIVPCAAYSESTAQPVFISSPALVQAVPAGDYQISGSFADRITLKRKSVQTAP